MKTSFARLGFGRRIAAQSFLALVGFATQGAPAQKTVPDQILVRPIAHLSEQAVQTVFAAHGASQVDAIPQIDVRVLKVPAANRARVLQALQHNPNIEFAELNALATPSATTNDPYVVNNYEWHLLKLQAFQAWDISVGTNAVVAICDSGVDPTQPDLVGKLLPGYNVYAGNTGTSAPQYPAACKNVVAVSATGYDDDFQTWSSYGSDVSLSAPGIGIWTTKNDGTYGGFAGTSAASPVAAGCGALLVGYN